jgi:hypothetical protein
MCGDGLSASDWASEIHDGWSQLGAKNKYLIIMRRPNDYAYYGLNGVSTKPRVSDGANSYEKALTDMFAALDVSDPGWSGHYTRIPQGTGWGANTGGFTLANYYAGAVNASTANGRTNVTCHDGSVDVVGLFSLTLASDYLEAGPNQVHVATQSGHNSIVAVVRTWVGL